MGAWHEFASESNAVQREDPRARRGAPEAPWLGPLSTVVRPRVCPLKGEVTLRSEAERPHKASLESRCWQRVGKPREEAAEVAGSASHVLQPEVLQCRKVGQVGCMWLSGS